MSKRGTTTATAITQASVFIHTASDRLYKMITNGRQQGVLRCKRRTNELILCMLKTPKSHAF